ncbi:unnamed protein product [Bursaphelenchus xylophilus]|uniref:(pine wood nematode) hypothetical protein n=1 Tax=Bursaphelenchus xylophilus TaxID=6326 RepID=A0A7I8X8K5_BURXY|nr:unnamed protein product [Bursaphelenchus xylophilus]CAG9119009.1 unnamed protein product [Bursaphelenchus xylophilus]
MNLSLLVILVMGLISVAVVEAVAPRGISNGQYTLYIQKNEVYFRRGPLKFNGPEKYKPRVLNFSDRRTPAIFYSHKENGRGVAYDFLNKRLTEKPVGSRLSFVDWSKSVAPFA